VSRALECDNTHIERGSRGPVYPLLPFPLPLSLATLHIVSHPTSYTLHPCTPHPTPHTPHPAPCTLHPTPYTLHPSPYTLHPTPYTMSPGFEHPEP
jgi:hypothetical protein